MLTRFGWCISLNFIPYISVILKARVFTSGTTDLARRVDNDGDAGLYS